jgi:DNA-directed RNA polymerase sigma subunit (sigma70/sigma32)
MPRKRDESRYEAALDARLRGLTLKATGELLGVSKERARQMQFRAIARRLGISPSDIPRSDPIDFYRRRSASPSLTM